MPTTAPAPPGIASTAAVKPDVAAPATERRPPRKLEKRVEKKPSPPKNDSARIELDRPEKPDAAPAPVKKHSGRAAQDVKHDADALYRKKSFSNAASLVSSAVPSFTGNEAQELKSLATTYAQFGKDYNIGMAPGTKLTDAFVALRRALSYDRDLGSGYIAEIQERLVQVATRAAVSYMAAKEYESAFLAVRTSDSLGSNSPSNKTVRDKLDALANDLYRTATSDLATDPDSAKRKLRQIQSMVDIKSPVYAKATKLLSGS